MSKLIESLPQGREIVSASEVAEALATKTGENWENRVARMGKAADFKRQIVSGKISGEAVTQDYVNYLDENFPTPVYFGGRRRYYRIEEINAWWNSRMERE